MAPMDNPATEGPRREPGEEPPPPEQPMAKAAAPSPASENPATKGLRREIAEKAFLEAMRRARSLFSIPAALARAEAAGASASGAPKQGESRPAAPALAQPSNPPGSEARDPQQL